MLQWKNPKLKLCARMIEGKRREREKSSEKVMNKWSLAVEKTQESNKQVQLKHQLYQNKRKSEECQKGGVVNSRAQWRREMFEIKRLEYATAPTLRRQASLSGHQHFQLNPKFYGSNEILEKVGIVAYKLQLLPGPFIYSILHVFQLKLKHVEAVHIGQQLLVVGPNGEIRIEPMKVLYKKAIKRRNKPVAYWLVQWMNRSEKAARWKGYELRVERYSHFILEDKNLVMERELSGKNTQLSSVERRIDFVKSHQAAKETEKEKEADGGIIVQRPTGGPRHLTDSQLVTERSALPVNNVRVLNGTHVIKEIALIDLKNGVSRCGTVAR